MPVMQSEQTKLLHSARRVCELFRGRFSEEVARKLIEDLGGELHAVDFVLNEKASVVSEYFNQNDDYVEDIRSNSQKIANLLENGIEYEVCQFACERCDSSWWKKVPCRKQVSKCRNCKVKYDPVPEDRQWGWAKFVCACANEFHAFGEKGVTVCKCYKCQAPVTVDRVLPPRRRIGATKKSRKPHSCNGENCFNKHDDYIGQSMASMNMTSYKSHHASHHNNITYQITNVSEEVPAQDYKGKGKNANETSGGAGAYPTDNDKKTPPVCIHPMSQKPGHRIRTPSQRHVSTGSTVNTFLSQGSLDTASIATMGTTYVPSVKPIKEE